MMTGWDAGQAPGRTARVMIAVTLLALLLVAAVPVALLAAVVMIILGHAAAGLALSGGWVLAAAAAVTLAGMNGRRQLRRLLSGDSFRAARPDGSQDTAAGPAGSHYTNLVQLDRSEYTEVR
jgi:hypothetical protein